MDVLPTYEQATTRPDWLQVAAPYIAFTDYPSLCRVSRRFWSVFAPRLWRDPCAASKRLGWSTDYDTRHWWARFLSRNLRRLTPKTRLLIRVLDARGASGPQEFDMYPELDSDAFKRALELLPNVEALVLDGHAGLNVRFLDANAQQPLGSALRLLSLDRCPYAGITVLMSGQSLDQLIYLDMSGISMPISHQAFDFPLPRLRILKLRSNAIYTSLAQDLRVFNRSLWSLDLSDNKLTDCFVNTLLRRHFDPDRYLRTRQHAATEGMIAPWVSLGDLREAASVREVHGSSDIFLPGDRYLVDAPAFSDSSNSESEMGVARSDGSVPIRTDTLDGILRLLSRDNGTVTTDHLPGSKGLTHLHLSGNDFSAVGVERLLRDSNGQMEHFDCDSMRLYLPDNHSGCDPKVKCNQFPRSTRLNSSSSIKMYGFSGFSHIIRPVWSSNLRSLRIHHSFVTNIPTLRVPDCCEVENIYFAEKHILPGLDWAYSIAFLPDMNPRLESLTLTCLPRHSFGPLVHKLTFFLRLLGLQEQALSIMNKAETSRPGRPVRLVSGLRYLTLEMESMEVSSFLELDAGELMAGGEASFSFFDDPKEQPVPENPRPRVMDIWSPVSPKPDIIDQTQEVGFDVARGYYLEDHFTNARRDLTKERWLLCRTNIQDALVAVWAGNDWSPSPVVQVYRRLVLEYRVYEDLGSATIHHTRAGAPVGCLIFLKTWFFAALPQSLKMPPSVPSPVYQDVAAELRRRHVSTYEEFERIQQQNPHDPCFYWGGTFRIIDNGPVTMKRNMDLSAYLPR